MGTAVKSCSCRLCRRQGHSRRWKALMRASQRRLRHQTKVALRKDLDPPVVVSAPTRI